MNKPVSPKVVAMRVILYVPDKGVLLVQRADGEYAASIWELPGGKIDDDSMSLAEAAAREYYEETGIHIVVSSDAPYYWDMKSNHPDYQGIRYVCLIVNGYLQYPGACGVILSKEHRASAWMEPTPSGVDEFQEQHGSLMQETIDAISRYYSRYILTARSLKLRDRRIRKQVKRIRKLEKQTRKPKGKKSKSKRKREV